MVQTQFIMFMSYYSDYLFKSNDAGFKKTLEFLFASMRSTGDQECIGYAASECLSNMLHDPKVKERIVPLIPTLIGVLNEYSLNLSIPGYFDFLSNF